MTRQQREHIELALALITSAIAGMTHINARGLAAHTMQACEAQGLLAAALRTKRRAAKKRGAP